MSCGPCEAARDRRRDLRLTHPIASYVRIDVTRLDCEIIDLSAGGAQILIDHDLAGAERVRLMAPACGELEATVISATAGVARLRFEAPPHESVEALRRLTWSKLAACVAFALLVLI